MPPNQRKYSQVRGTVNVGQDRCRYCTRPLHDLINHGITNLFGTRLSSLSCVQLIPVYVIIVSMALILQVQIIVFANAGHNFIVLTIVITILVLDPSNGSYQRVREKVIFLPATQRRWYRNKMLALSIGT